ncbi:nucleotide sugar dehydratase [Streptococcus porcinus]|uniref:Nucleotide sugar dehydratase n=3 Tax=Streptococcus porcinus TaxID=1340 RepID=A0A4V0H5G4_STRPO|nr:nucleotide sugar dehydratase [Streptococcus porcinus]VTT44444.1 nucleotide sugar dehydratase [Streptococcus porcinus]VTT45746.1 nucleotide sugar dehydratase [Streptococcus porcinus]
MRKFMDYKMISYSNTIVQEDLQAIIKDRSVAWDKLNHKSILITGANSMLATYMIYTLVYLNQFEDSDITIIATARNLDKAKERFKGLVEENKIILIQHDVNQPLLYDGTVDFIVHAASNASPHYILTDPVGIIKANTLGTLNLLEFAKVKEIENFLFMSTREIYGKAIQEVIDEEAYGAFDILESRACYPESKRIAETLLKSYSDQYQVPFTIARLAHVYGPGMEVANDGRIMSDLLNNVLMKEDIVLKSDGSAERAFCYLADATVALFLILLNGEIGQAYNIANEEEPIMIRNLAQLLVDTFPDKDLQVVFEIPSEASKAYSKMGRTRLSTEKIEKIGWKKKVSLTDGLVKTVKSFEEI